MIDPEARVATAKLPKPDARVNAVHALGRTVNLASRLCSDAEPGEILGPDSTLQGAGGASELDVESDRCAIPVAATPAAAPPEGPPESFRT